MSAITIEKMLPGEVSEVASVLSHAFLTQPNMAAIWNRQDEYVRHAIKTLFSVAKLERPVANVWVVRQNGQIIGALNMAEWPNCQLSPLETLAIMPRTLGLFKSTMFRALQLQSAWAKHDPKQRHWHLGPVGVLPKVQGQGVGSRLLEECCKIIDQGKDAAYLETDRAINVPFYERFGFAVTEKQDILGVTNWFMWRAAR